MKLRTTRLPRSSEYEQLTVVLGFNPGSPHQLWLVLILVLEFSACPLLGYFSTGVLQQVAKKEADVDP